MFSGDLIFAKMFPYASDPTANPDQWIKGLEKIAARSIEKIVPGHGAVWEIDEVREYLRFFNYVK